MLLKQTKKKIQTKQLPPQEQPQNQKQQPHSPPKTGA